MGVLNSRKERRRVRFRLEHVLLELSLAFWVDAFDIDRWRLRQKIAEDELKPASNQVASSEQFTFIALVFTMPNESAIQRRFR